MIDLTHIDDFSHSYNFFNLYLKQFHNWFYYKRVYVVGRKNIPEKGKPVIIIANHQNGANDALNILYMFNDHRQPVFIARGDIFKKDAVAKILRYLKILPTFRTRDGGFNDVKYNMTSFDIASDILTRGNTLVIYPEAQHQQGHYLGTFKKGFPRIAFAAEEKADFKLGLQILPINIHYLDYFNARTKVSLTVGEPFGFDEFFETFKTDPNIAYQQLNAKARAQLKALTPDIELHQEYLKEIELLRTMWVKPCLTKKGLNPNYFPYHRAEEITIIDRITKMKTEEPDRFEYLMLITRQYIEELEQLNLRDWVVGQEISLSQLLGKTLIYLILLPLFLFGLINNAIPFYFPAYLRRNIKDRHLHASFHCVGSIVSFTLYYPIMFAILWIVSKSVLFALAYIVAMFASFFIFFEYKRSWLKFSARWRYYFKQLIGMTSVAEEYKSEIMKQCE